MKFAFDLHGVIDKYPELFKPIMESLNVVDGFHVYVISGSPKLDILDELETLGIEDEQHYGTILSGTDYLKSKGIDMWRDEKGHWWCDDGLWWECKGHYCRKHKIDVLYDNNIEYAKHLPEFTNLYIIK